MTNSGSLCLPRIQWKAWASIAAAYLGLYALWLMFQPGGERWRLPVGDLAILPPGLLAALAALSLSKMPLGEKTPREVRQRRAWTFLGLAILVWGLGDITWTFYELILHIEAPLFSLADPVYLAGYVLAGAALLIYPARPRTHFGRARVYLDLLITAAAITTLGLVTLILPIIRASSASPAETYWGAVYPTADLALLLLLIAIFLISEPHGLRSGFGFVVAGLFAFLVTDIAYGFLAVQGRYETGNLIDLGWPIGDCLMALGALYQWEHPDRPAPANEVIHRLRVGQRLQALLPPVSVFALAWYTLVDWQMTGHINYLAGEIAALLGIALVVRQGVVAGEAELRQYAHLVNSAADPAFICDATGRLRLVNPALLAATGYEREDDLLGRSVLTLLAPDSPIANRLAQMTYRRDDKPYPIPHTPYGIRNTQYLLEAGWSGEARLIRRDGSEFPAYLSLRPVQSGTGSRRPLAGTAHDLTEQKRQQAVLSAAYDEVAAARRALEALNAQLEQKVEEKTRSLSEAHARLEEQNQELKTLDKLKSEFVALVSHELRAPLTNVVGGIELVLARPAYDVPPETREVLAIVQAELRRLTQFVETILDLSALDAGRLPLNPVPISIGQVAQTIRDRFSVANAADRLRLDLPEGLPPLLADERALTSAVFHLVDNALKYAPEGEVVIESRAQDGRVYLSVSDHGPGIPPELRELVFEKFHRLDTSDAQTVYGHGLGLYLTRRLLLALGGDIQVDESPGGGARFTLWMPVAADQDE